MKYPGFFKHRRFNDVLMYVVRREFRDEERIKLKIRWWNIAGYWCHEGFDHVTVKVRDLPNWRRVDAGADNLPVP